MNRQDRPTSLAILKAFQKKKKKEKKKQTNRQKRHTQVKSQLSGSSSSPGYSQHMAELSNSGGVQAPENFPSTKGQRSRFGHAPHQLG